MVNDDKVQGQEGVSWNQLIQLKFPSNRSFILFVTSDVDNLEPGEGEDGESLELGLVGASHEEHLLL